DGRNRRGCAEQNQHLLLACADRNLLKRAFRNDVALLVGLAETARERNTERKQGRERHAQPRGTKPARPSRLLLHSHIPLRPIPLNLTSLSRSGQSGTCQEPRLDPLCVELSQ